MRAKHFQYLIVIFSACFLAQTASGQDDSRRRFDAFAGFTYFESPLINLAERGYHLQFGYNPKSWYAMGFDYSQVDGTLNIIPTYLPKATQVLLGPLLNNLTPGYHPAVPTHTTTQTFALGPSLVIRHFRHMAILLHPSLGAVREIATPHPNDILTTLAASLLFTGTKKLDWTGFYGIGGGLDFGVTKHIGVRMQTDLVYDHLINDILGQGHWTVRASIGPSFHFGKRIP